MLLYAGADWYDCGGLDVGSNIRSPLFAAVSGLFDLVWGRFCDILAVVLGETRAIVNRLVVGRAFGTMSRKVAETQRGNEKRRADGAAAPLSGSSWLQPLLPRIVEVHT